MEQPELHTHHEAHGTGPLAQTVAIFTAIVATLAAVCSYFGGHTEDEALYYKNDAVLNRTEASDQWAYYQAKSIKLAILQERIAGISDPQQAQPLQAKADEYTTELQQIRSQAEALEKAADQSNVHAEHSLHPHEKLALAITLFQIAISAASITALTRRRWLLAVALASALGAVAVWAAAFLI